MDNKSEMNDAPESVGKPESGTTPQETGELAPKMLTVSPSPHIRSVERTSALMLDVAIALLPALIWGAYIFGTRAVAITLLSVGSCVGFEALSQFLLHRPITISDLSATVTGLLLAMNLPVSVPLWTPVVGGFFAVVIVKQLFGGIGKNFVNPALCARVFLLSSWAGDMSVFPAFGSRINSLAVELAESDIVAGATPLAALKSGELSSVNLFDMIIGNMNGCIGEVSALLLAAGGVYLMIRRVVTWHIPVAYIGTVALLTLVFPQYGGVALDFMLSEIFSGGLFLGAFFMATDYSTSPVTPNGKLLYGVGCGAITVMIRYFGAYPEGVSFAVLIMNLTVWYLDKFTMPKRFGGASHGKK